MRRTILSKFIIIAMISALVLCGCGKESKKPVDEAQKQTEEDVVYESVDIGKIDTNFQEIKDKFGAEKETSTAIDHTTYIYDGMEVTVDSENNVILYGIDYSRTKGKDQYSFQGIDGNSTKQDVINTFGDENADIGDSYASYSMSNLELEYNIGGTLRFSFDKDGKVKAIVIGHVQV